MKKTIRIFTAVLAAAVMTTAVFGLVGCDTAEIGETDPNLGTTDEQYLVEGMSAYDLIMEAYANWCADDGYVRRERFAFTARMPGPYHGHTLPRRRDDIPQTRRGRDERTDIFHQKPLPQDEMNASETQRRALRGAFFKK